MKKLLFLLLMPTFSFADRLGGLRSGADVLLTTQTISISSTTITNLNVTTGQKWGVGANEYTQTIGASDLTFSAKLNNGFTFNTNSATQMMSIDPTYVTFNVPFEIFEGVAPGGVSNADILYGDSTAHWLKMNNNGSSTNYTVVGTSTPNSSGTIPIWSSNNKSLIDSGNAILNGSINVTSNTISPGTTFYQDGTADVSIPGKNTIIGGGIIMSSQAIAMGTYNASCLDPILLASAAFSNNPPGIINLPSASSCPGKILPFWKVDQDTTTFIVNSAIGDIVVGTPTIRLNARSQGCAVQSDGVSAWNSYGKCQFQPSFIGAIGPGAVNAAIPASSSTVSIPFTTDSPMWIGSFRTNVTNPNSGTITFAIYDQVGNLLVSTGPLTGVSGFNTYAAITPPFYLPPGNYIAGEQYSTSTTATIGKWYTSMPIGCYTQTNITMNPPNPLSFATVTNVCPLLTIIPYGGPFTQ